MNDDEEELAFLRTVFRKFDTDNSGFLEGDQFINLIQALARHVPEIEHIDTAVVNAIFSYYDEGYDGKLSFQELYTWWVAKNRFKFFVGDKARLMRKAHQIFLTYSESKKGLTYSEFETLLGDLAIEHEEGTFDEIDYDGDGLVSFTEFVDWLGWFE